MVWMKECWFDGERRSWKCVDGEMRVRPDGLPAGDGAPSAFAAAGPEVCLEWAVARRAWWRRESWIGGLYEAEFAYTAVLGRMLVI
jgi:hypothetical protein